MARDDRTQPSGESSRELTDLSTFPTSARVTERDELMSTATRILDIHRVDPDDGSCTGCLTQWDRWIWFKDCAQQNWAQSVVETHGAAADLDESLLPDTAQVL